eukprot:m.178827 g.178827  ORF g.178827 m.178827 type:complete len:95 (-) comp53404_c1_seq3:58-342(-)
MLRVVTGALRNAYRGVMSSKRGNKHYYKGKGANPTGFHTKKGGYIIDPVRKMEYIVPDLTGFELKPYVSFKAPLVRGKQPTAADFADLLSQQPK